MSLSANEVADPAARPRPYLAVAFGLVVLILIAYIPIHWNDFIYLDDGDYITSNPPIAKGLTPETFRWAWTTNHHGYWHPLTWLSLLADVSLFGYGPWGMHFTNLVLHALVSVALFVVFVRMTDEFWPSAILAGLFAVHPMHVESVAWAAERKDVLSTLFLVLTIACYLEAVRRPSLGRHALTAVCFTLGLLAKPMLVTLPFALLLLDVWPLRRTNLSGPEPSRFPRRSWIELVLEKLPLFALAFAFSLLTFSLQKNVGAVVSLRDLPWQPRIANVLNGYVWYLGNTLVPTHLGVFHTHRYRIPPAEMILPTLILVSITILLIYLACFRKHPELLIGWLWFGGTLFPVSGIAQSGPQAYADRFVYVPHIGLFIVLVWGSMILFRRFRLETAGAWLAACAILACAALTFRQAAFWRNTETLFAHTLAVTTDNYWANTMLGEYYYVHDKFDAAAEQCEIALKVDPKTREVWDLLARIDIARARYAAAETSLRKSLELWEGNPETHHRLAYVLDVQQKHDDAADILEKLLVRFPRRAESQGLLGSIRRVQRRYDDATAHLLSAIEIKADFPEAHQELALVYLQRNELDRAEKHFSEAIRLRPDSPKEWTGLFRALYRKERWQDAAQVATDAMGRFAKDPVYRGERALALYRMGLRTEARTEYDELERVSPGWAANMATTAMRMATSTDDTSRHEALEFAEQAAQSTEFGNARALEALAAAQANLGRFDDAIATIDRALALPMTPPELGERLRDDRAKFARREPLRE